MVIEVTPDGRSYYWLIGLLIGLPLATLIVASLFSKDTDFWPLLTSLGGILSIAPPIMLAIGLFFILKGSIRLEAESLKIDAMITKKNICLTRYTMECRHSSLEVGKRYQAVGCPYFWCWPARSQSR